MSCPTDPEPGDRFALAPGVVLRAVPEWGVAYAYTPARPALLELNATAWAIAALCDGATLAAIEEGFADLVRGVAGANRSRDVLARGLAALLAHGIVRRLNDDGGPAP
ncbi:MAG: hypothetical protein NZM07_06650 [Elioraea sp.]|nr:hypothetical protein [Elioraea sp.]